MGLGRCMHTEYCTYICVHVYKHTHTHTHMALTTLHGWRDQLQRTMAVEQALVMDDTSRVPRHATPVQSYWLRGWDFAKRSD